MNFHNITTHDMKNGYGLRTVLWVAGCDHYCKNCHNPVTWDENSGLPFDDKAWQELLEYLSKPYISGLTLSGGDPLYKPNREAIGNIIEKTKRLLPEKSIWLYTGYLWEDVKNLPFMHFVDVMVDGKFVEEEKDTQLHWKGSANQRIIDVQKSLSSNTVLLYE